MTLDEIDKLTIAEVRAINERAGEALKTLQSLGLVTAPHYARLVPAVTMTAGTGASPASPFPCTQCGRVAPERPGDNLQAAECQLCGNHLPGVAPLSNKGPIVWSAEELARRRATPAFDANGEPVVD